MACSVPKLSVVVIFYNMSREARRTLHSLTSTYQASAGDLAHEVVVVDNGSSQPLDPGFVEEFGTNFSYHFIEDASHSPASAINFGVSRARGEYVGIMIDGAHILTPGVFKYFDIATKCYENPVVAPRGWFVGPGQQAFTMTDGYDQTVEDELFASIEWPNNGYRLFEIGEIIGTMRPGWFNAIKETNCLMVRKSIFESIGGACEAFDLPGGGFLNLDMLNQCCKLEDTNLVSIIGEGTFHQFHGGTITNKTRKDRKRLLEDYRNQYKGIRGEDLRLPDKPVEYVGRMNHYARKHLPKYVRRDWDSRS